MAASKLKKIPTHEEIIIEYKGWQNRKSALKDAALTKYRNDYAKLKSK